MRPVGLVVKGIVIGVGGYGFDSRTDSDASGSLPLRPFFGSVLLRAKRRR